jgi:energy-coupling factor transporter ATP-binding protein EcfA2
MTPALQLLTFEDIVELAESRRSKARADDKVAGWERLLDVARGLAGAGGGADDLAVGRTWSLVKIRIQGYQGISAEVPLEIDLDPTPGVTVLHGINGSGKSSIADAIETALHGEPRKPVSTGGGGSEPLWERQHCGRDADEAVVEVTVLASGERLVLSCRLESNGQVIERRAQHVIDSSTTDVDLATTTWQSALAGIRPVFGYAAVERQVQLARNLQEFLEPLLAFGGCFDALQSAISTAGSASDAAERRWTTALGSARAAVAELDAERRRSDATGLPDIPWPDIADDPDRWLDACELTETGASVAEVTEQHHERLHTAARGVTAALRDLVDVETSLHTRLAGPLHDMHGYAAALPNPGETCPVCTTEEVPWTSRLDASIGGLVAIEPQDTAVRSWLGELRRALDTELDGIVEVLRQDWFDPVIATAAEPVINHCADLRRALDQYGLRPTPNVRETAATACESLMSKSWRAIVLEAARRSGHRRQWLRARRAAVDLFVDCWRECAAEGSAAASWKAAKKCLNDVHTHFRTERGGNLHTLTDSAVQELLHDVGLSVTSISVQGTKAAVQVTDSAGKVVRLSMLSAGQRNALLLAPLLGVAGGGPFGFLVLDDPVHAFDQVRVDRLARIIHGLTVDRRVIVLTHDERLKEHLLARSTDCDVRSVRRDAATGIVTAERTENMWKVLLKDARSTLHVVASHAGGVTTTPDDLVRGLCRMALDNALRQFVIQEAADRDPADDLKRLDAAKTTRDRIRTAQELHPSSSAPAAAEAYVTTYFQVWNDAAHGMPSTSPARLPEIAAAENACTALAP